MRIKQAAAIGWGALLVAGLTVASHDASATSTWVAKGRGASAHVEGTSRAPGSRLWLSCADGLKLYLYPPAWDSRKAGQVYLAIDGGRTAVSVDYVDEGVVLSDLANDEVGISRSLLARMSTGKSLVISGAPAAKIPPAKLAFSLDGAGAAIAAFERTCPAARRKG